MDVLLGCIKKRHRHSRGYYERARDSDWYNDSWQEISASMLPKDEDASSPGDSAVHNAPMSPSSCAPKTSNGDGPPTPPPPASNRFSASERDSPLLNCSKHSEPRKTSGSRTLPDPDVAPCLPSDAHAPSPFSSACDSSRSSSRVSTVVGSEPSMPVPIALPRAAAAAAAALDCIVTPPQTPGTELDFQKIVGGPTLPPICLSNQENLPNVTILSPPVHETHLGALSAATGTQPSVEWQSSFPVGNMTNLGGDQKMLSVASSPQLTALTRNKLDGGLQIGDQSSSQGAPVFQLIPPPSTTASPLIDNKLELVASLYDEMIQKRRGAETEAEEAAPERLARRLEEMSLSSKFGSVLSDDDAFVDFEFLAVLGKGNFGKVILSRDKKKQGRLCAIKVLKKREIIKKREVVHTMTEAAVLKSLRHPFLVECFASFQTATRLCLVLEFVRGGELYFHLFRRRRFSEEHTKFYVAEIVLAVGYLHANEFIYRDLKLENLLLDAEGHIKIADFGLCKDLRAWEESLAAATSPTGKRRPRKDMTFCGTPEYLAPEMLQVPGSFNGVSRGGGTGCGLVYGKGVDWWALGIIIFEMILGKLPFRTKTGDYDQLFHSICHRDITFPDHLRPSVRELLDGLLQKNPLLRLGHSNGNGRDYLDICAAAWFGEVDWDAVYRKQMTPPFVPVVDSEEDTRHFSKEFLDLTTDLTPTTSFASNVAESVDDHFKGFSFSRN